MIAEGDKIRQRNLKKHQCLKRINDLMGIIVLLIDVNHLYDIDHIFFHVITCDYSHNEIL